MGENGLRPEQPHLVEPGDRRHAVRLDAFADLARRLAGVDVNPVPVFRIRRDPPQHRLGDGVDRVRPVDHLNPPGIPAVPLQQRGVVMTVALKHFTVGPGDVQQPERGAQTGLFDRPRRIGLVPVHVAEEHRAAANHFERRQPGADVDVVPGQLRFRRPDVIVEPTEKLHVVGIAAQQGHRRMGVGVVKGRHDRLAGAVHHLCAFRLDAGRDSFEAVAFDQDISTLAVELHVADQNRIHLPASSFASSGATAPDVRTVFKILSSRNFDGRLRPGESVRVSNSTAP